MEPSVRYVTTADGVRIAYGVAGTGAPLVRVPSTPFAHFHQWWKESPFFANLSERWMVVTFDPRGTGMSQRDVGDLELDARVMDLEAVVDQLGLERFALHGTWDSGAIVIAYAVRHPERVRRLVLDDAYADSRDFYETPQGKAYDALAQDWDGVLDYVASLYYGHFGEERVRLVKLLRECVTPDVGRRYIETLKSVDVSDLLPRISMPTLIARHVGIREFGAEHARRMAAVIPDAEILLLHGIQNEDLDTFIPALESFLGDAQPVKRPESPATTHGGGTAVILFTDIADSTPLTERMGDAAFRALSRSIDKRVRAAIREHAGAPVEGKVLGDGVMGVFSSAAQAIGAARACAELGSELPMHIGLHAGDVLSEGTNVYGGAVNIASRICGLCAPGEILVSATVRELARTSAGVTFEDRGEQAIKGIDDPVRVFAVRTLN